MATAIRVLHEPQPAPGAHPLDVAAERRFIQLEMLCQLRWPSLFSIGDRNEHAELAGLQSGACKCAVIDRADHPIQLAHATTDAYAFDALGIQTFGIQRHALLYMHAFASRQPSRSAMLLFG